MDSRIVSGRIRHDIWPTLRAAGFQHFSTRTGWRHSDYKIDVVNFQSFNSYLAERVDCTPFSFSLNLGCHLNFVPPLNSRTKKTRDGLPLPQEYECHLRRRLQKTVSQLEPARRDTWYIGSNGEYLPESIADARTQLQVEGLRWFGRFADEEELLRTLTQDSEGETFGFGAVDSPFRRILLGYLQLWRRDHTTARQLLSEAMRQLQQTALPELHNFLQAQLAKTLGDMNP